MKCEMDGLQFAVIGFEDLKDFMYATLIPECCNAKQK